MNIFKLTVVAFDHDNIGINAVTELLKQNKILPVIVIDSKRIDTESDYIPPLEEPNQTDNDA